jgi:hypothetical protein
VNNQILLAASGKVSCTVVINFHTRLALETWPDEKSFLSGAETPGGGELAVANRGTTDQATWADDNLCQNV